MAHSHGHYSRERSLGWAIALNFFITAVQIVGGLISNSLSLLSDAVHNLGDATAILLAFFASKISRRQSSAKRTFGYKRIEILAALFNSLVLIGICIFLFIEAYHRFLNPQPIKGAIMFSVAIAGFLANLVAVFVLRDDKEKSINIKAAYLHLLGDTLSSVAVIAGGIAIFFWEVYWLDPLVTVIIGAYIVWHTFGVLRQTVKILMQVTPEHIDLQEIKSKMEQYPGIANIHHLHVWNLTDREIHLECHIDLTEDLRVSQTDEIKQQLEQILDENFGIGHVTVQFELDSCHDKRMVWRK